jgi:hypothetical protein
METDYMENLAREYNNALRLGANGNDNLLRQVADVLYRQLDIITCWLYSVRSCNRSLSYIESLKRQSLREVNTLLGNMALEFRDRARCSCNYFNKLVELQIELFIYLDELKKNGAAVDNILALETRALGFFGTIR